MPTGDPVPGPNVRYDVMIESITHTGAAPITLTATSLWGDDAAGTELVIQALVDLIAGSSSFRLMTAQKATTASAPITPTPPGGA